MESPKLVTDTMAVQAGLSKFDPNAHPGEVYDAFVEFVDAFAYEYEAICKDPPAGLDETQKTAWIDQNKRKQFLGRFASRNLQRDFEDSVPKDERSTISFDDTVKKLKERYKPTRNVTLANYQFHKLAQREVEMYDAFVNRVKHEANNCEFSCDAPTCTVKDILIRDQIIVGTSDDEIRKNALNNQWTLTDLVAKGRKIEAASIGAMKIKEEKVEDTTIGRVGKPGKYSKKKKAQEKLYSRPSKERCQNCSSRLCRGDKKCFAYGMDCFACGKEGHFKGATVCKKSRKKGKSKARRVNDSSETETEDETSGSNTNESSSDEADVNRVKPTAHQAKQCRYVGHVRRSKFNIRKTKAKYQVPVIIKEKEVIVFADTGADVCVMSRANARKLELPLEKTKMQLKPYGSKKYLRCVGYYVGPVMYYDNVANIGIYVVKKNVETLLSGPASEALGIISFNGSHITDEADINRTATSRDPTTEHIIQQCPEVFTGIGKLRDHQVKLHVDENVPPVAIPPRPVPFHLRKRTKKELERMEAQGIIEDHEGPAPWVSNIVLAPKENGDVRITIDMRKPNEAIKDTKIPIPRAEDIRSELAGAKYFSKLDFKSAYHQLELAPESRYLTVFHAGEKLMRYKRLTMGVMPASGELNKVLRPLFNKIPNAHVIHDDLIIATVTDEEHDKAITDVLQVIKNSGLTLNSDKCLFKKKEIPFWGIIVSDQGVRPDPEKVQSLRNATRPRNRSEVMSFLCMLQSNSEFIPNLSKETINLRELTKKNKRFQWTPKCQNEFDHLKELFCEEALLQYFDPEQPTYLFVDAHKSGLSAILAQGESPEKAHMITCASRATNPIERRYPQLDLEALSVDFALRRFRKYLVGGPKSILFTDHKPLISIFGNTRHGSVRTDRIKLRHQDILYQVVWRAGIDNPADFLSRHAVPWQKLPRSWKHETEELEKTVWFLQFAPYTEAISFKRMIAETEKDKLLKRLKKYLMKGYIPKSDEELRPYRLVINDLTISDTGLILKDERIVLPKSLWKLAVEKAHQGGHPGMTNMKRRLRTHFWIPKMNELVEKKVQTCPSCQVFSPKTTKEPISPQVTPQTNWSDISIDLFGPMPDKRHVLVAQDNKSRFPAAKIVPSTAATPVLNALGEMYNCYGNPEQHRTDNGTPFNSDAFKEFSDSRDIDHVKVFPYHPQGNPAETYMKPLGKALKAAYFNRENAQKAVDDLLAAYRSTPHPATNTAPGDMLFRDGYRSTFPRKPAMEQEIIAAHNRDQEQKLTRKEKVNNSAHRKTDTVIIGDKVLMKDKTKKHKFDPLFLPSPMTVLSCNGKGVVIQAKDGSKYRRHKDDIKSFYDNPESTSKAQVVEKKEEDPLYISDSDRNIEEVTLPEYNQLSEPTASVEHHSATSIDAEIPSLPRAQRNRQPPDYLQISWSKEGKY